MRSLCCKAVIAIIHIGTLLDHLTKFTTREWIQITARRHSSTPVQLLCSLSTTLLIPNDTTFDFQLDVTFGMTETHLSDLISCWNDTLIHLTNSIHRSSGSPFSLTNGWVFLFTGYQPSYKVPMSPAIKREEISIDGSTASTSRSIAQLYQQLTSDSLRRSLCDQKHDPDEELKQRDDQPDDNNDDEDIDDDDTRNDEPCDLRLFTPTTCLREIYPEGEFSGQSSSASLVPYLAGGGAALAESIMKSHITKFPAYKSSPAGPSSSGSVGGLPTGAATIPPLRNIRISGPGGSGTGLGTGGSNQTTPGGAYSCHRCGNSYARPHSLNRHIRFECGVEPKFECPVCHKKSKHKHNLVLHMRTHQQRWCVLDMCWPVRSLTSSSSLDHGQQRSNGLCEFWKWS